VVQASAYTYAFVWDSDLIPSVASRAISHPNVVQAFTCITDVPVSELLRCCMNQAQPPLLQSSVYQYLQSMAENLCHVEVRMVVVFRQSILHQEE
jgi:hypothetical protein